MGNNMKKQLGLAFLGLLTANSAFAGLYVGGGAGYQRLESDKHSYTMPKFTEDNAKVTTRGSKGTGNAVVGNIFMGYEFLMGERFGIAAESVFQPGKTETKVSYSHIEDGVVVPFDTRKKRLSNSWGFNVKPAFYLTDATKLFATVGWQQARLKEVSTQLNEVTIQSQGIKNSKRVNGLVLGGGLEVALPIDGGAGDSPLAVRAEYASVNYEKGAFGAATRTHSVFLSLVYKFA
jgi:opacity protein-like surface antigen